VERQNPSTKAAVVTDIIVIRNHDLQRTIFVIAGRAIHGTAASAASAAAAAALSSVLEQ
jgi:hypothetical protein